MTDKTQYSQDSSVSTLTKEEKRKAYNQAYYKANKEKTKAQRAKNNKIYQQTNKEKIKKHNANYRKRNKEKISNIQKAYRDQKVNKDKQRIRHKAYRKANKDKQKKRYAKWKTENIEDARKWKRQYEKNRRQKDPLYKFFHSIRIQCNRVVKHVGLGKKPTNTFKWVGCSPEQLKAHIESLFLEGMTWDNYGKYGWHVDHIRPVSSFKPEEWEQINHYTNLQPLWWQDNLSKSNNYY